MFLLGLVLLVCLWSPVESACDPAEEGQRTTLTYNIARCPSGAFSFLWEAATVSSSTKPTSPSCTVTENPRFFVTVTCSADIIYPPATCNFERRKNGGNSVTITRNPKYKYTASSTNPGYYSFNCTVSMYVEELGEGTHSFHGMIYPDVPGGLSGNAEIKPAKTVTLSFSQASHTCTTNKDQGYFLGKSATCTCSITSDGNPRGRAQWYRGDNPVGTTEEPPHSPVGREKELYVTYDKNNDEQNYTCETESVLGRNFGSDLFVQFAFLDLDSVQVEPLSPLIKICNNTGQQAQVICQISKENVSPAPTFSFSLDGLTFDNPKPGIESNDSVYYQRQFSFSRDVGGEYQVYCRVTNTILNTNQQGDTQVVFQKFPRGLSQVTVAGQSYQGTASPNVVTLAEGYSGDVICRVEKGGYPYKIYPYLTCVTSRGDTGIGYSATLSFKDRPLTRDMDGDECFCWAYTFSNCYVIKETKLILNVTYPPKVFINKNPTAAVFKEGGSVTVLCSAQGNPDPSTTLTTESTNGTVVLANVHTGTLTHTLDSLDCLDTGVYVCSGQNSRGTNFKNISIIVRCPQQISPTFDPPPIINAMVGDTTQIALEIYGFPEPKFLSLLTIDGIERTPSPRYTVKYTAKDVPFGVVTVTIFDIVEADYTYYTLTVDNGEEVALIYNFSLKKKTKKGAGGESLNITAIIIGVIALIILATSFVVIFFLVRRNRILTKGKVTDPGLYLVPIDTPDIVNNLQKQGIPRPRQYRDVMETGFSPILTEPVASQVNETNDTSPETGHYETLPDMTYTSGLTPQDVEPPNIYRRPIPDTSSTRHDTPSGDYCNIPEQHGETPCSDLMSPSAGAVMKSLPVVPGQKDP